MTTHPDYTPLARSRRHALLVGLGAVAGLAAGCSTGSRSARLPSPAWPDSNDPVGPVIARGDGQQPFDPNDYESRPGVSESSELPAVEVSVSGVIPRSKWTRKGLANPSVAYPMKGVRRITIHHDGMPPVSLRSSSDVAHRLESIRRAHTGRGWADIGYHYVIDPSGRVWAARPIRYQGAHVRNHNPHNLGVMVLGNFEQQAPTSAARRSLDRFVAAQALRYRVPLKEIYTHRELGQTACPGRNLQAHMIASRRSGGGIASVLSKSSATYADALAS